MTYKLADNVIGRIAQIVQEGMLLGIDVVDLMRQIEVVPSADGTEVDLTSAYIHGVKQTHEKLLEDLKERQQTKTKSSLIFE